MVGETKKKKVCGYVIVPRLSDVVLNVDEGLEAGMGDWL